MAAKDIKEAIKELWYWQYGDRPTNFTSQLFYLFQKADPDNKRRLQEAFPHEGYALRLWEMAEDPEEFFQQYGFNTHRGINED